MQKYRKNMTKQRFFDKIALQFLDRFDILTSQKKGRGLFLVPKNAANMEELP